MSVSPEHRGPGIRLGGSWDPSRPQPPIGSPNPPNRPPRLSDNEDVEVGEPRIGEPVGVFVQDEYGVWRREASLPVELLPAELDGARWSSPVRFSDSQPDPAAAPPGAVWVDLSSDDLKLYGKEG